MLVKYSCCFLAAELEQSWEIESAGWFCSETCAGKNTSVTRSPWTEELIFNAACQQDLILFKKFLLTQESFTLLYLTYCFLYAAVCTVFICITIGKPQIWSLKIRCLSHTLQNVLWAIYTLPWRELNSLRCVELSALSTPEVRDVYTYISNYIVISTHSHFSLRIDTYSPDCCLAAILIAPVHTYLLWLLEGGTLKIFYFISE